MASSAAWVNAPVPLAGLVHGPQRASTTGPGDPTAPVWMWAAIAFAVRPSKDICHETDAPVSDLVTVAENVPLASDTAPLGDGTSCAAFITVRIWMSVACGLADAPTVATSAPASARAGMTARVLMNPSFRASVTPLWRGTTRVPAWRIDAVATRRLSVAPSGAATRGSRRGRPATSGATALGESSARDPVAGGAAAQGGNRERGEHEQPECVG